MKKQLAEYDSIMQSVRNLYLKQEENSEVFKELLAKFDAMTAAEDQRPEFIAEMKEYISKSDEFTHKECVKVYRNVQASVMEELNKQTEQLVPKLEILLAKNKSLTTIAFTSLCVSAASIVTTILLWLIASGVF